MSAPTLDLAALREALAILRLRRDGRDIQREAARSGALEDVADMVPALLSRLEAAEAALRALKGATDKLHLEYDADTMTIIGRGPLGDVRLEAFEHIFSALRAHAPAIALAREEADRG